MPSFVCFRETLVRGRGIHKRGLLFNDKRFLSLREART